jgi:predicted NAD/FAD-binding protein
VVGSGVAGLACAHLLGPVHDVVLFESDGRLGGHANTIEVDDPLLGRIGVDTGFIVHNDRNYPHLIRLFDELNVPVRDSEMSFAVHDRRTGFHYRATNLNTLFADRRRVVDPQMWRMLWDIGRFYRTGRAILDRVGEGDDEPWSMTIGDLLDEGRYGERFVEAHLIPMGAAVWSVRPSNFRDFPAVSLLRFLDNHGLLSVGNRPNWRTVVGGSQVYVKALIDRFEGSIRLNAAVTAVERTDDGVLVSTGGSPERYDGVILACHSDQSLRLLADPSPEERSDLAGVAYQDNLATLHTDTGVLPPARRAWAAWNYEVVAGNDKPTVTYDLSLLMRLESHHRYLVTLNDDGRIRDADVIARIPYQHPVFNHAAIRAQQRIRERNGWNQTWFCGAWMGYGFHEDGMRSAVEVTRGLGAKW